MYKKYCTYNKKEVSLKKYISFIISLFCIPILNIICMKVFDYINGRIQATFNIKYIIVLTIIKLIVILFLGFMLAYYFYFVSNQQKKTVGIFFIIEIFMIAIYIVTKKYYFSINSVYFYDLNILYFFLLLGENIFCFYIKTMNYIKNL